MSKDVVTTQPTAIRAFEADFGTVTEALAMNLGAGGLSAFDFPRIRIPSGGGTQWMVPTLEGESSEPTIEGVIVLTRDTRAYWRTEGGDAIAGTPPDCSSHDGIIGISHSEHGPGGACIACPLVKFGTDPKGGRAQACKQVKQIFMLRGSNLLPDVVGLPPTSLKAAKAYLLKLTSQGVPYFNVVTRIGLERMQNVTGQKYAAATFSFARMLTPDEAARSREYHHMLRPLVAAMPVDAGAADNTEGEAA